jgi:hypothetical protein
MVSLLEVLQQAKIQCLRLFVKCIDIVRVDYTSNQVSLLEVLPYWQIPCLRLFVVVVILVLAQLVPLCAKFHC